MLMLISDVVMPSVDKTNNKEEKEETPVVLPQPKSSISLMPSDMRKLLSTNLASKLTSKNTWKSCWPISKTRSPIELNHSKMVPEISSSGLLLTSMNLHSTLDNNTIWKTLSSCLTIKTKPMKPQPSFTFGMVSSPTKYDLCHLCIFFNLLLLFQNNIFTLWNLSYEICFIF